MINKIYNHIEFFFSDHKKIMLFTFCLGIILSVIGIGFCGSIYRDGILYSQMAHYFGLGDYSRGFQDWIPPLFPVLAGILCKIGVKYYIATMIVASTFCVLTIFPLYYILTYFVNKKYAAWGALLYLLTPKILRYGIGSSTIEGARFFLFILPICFLLSYVKEKRTYKVILFGVSLALLSLVRGEGIVSVPILLFALVILLLKENKYKITFKFISSALYACLLSIIVLLAIISPRLYQNYKTTGYPTLDERESQYIDMYYHAINKNRALSLQETNQKTVSNLSSTNITPLSEGKYITVKAHENLVKRILKSKFFAFLNDFSRGSFELYELFALIGLILLIKRWQWKLEHSFMVIFVIWNAILFYLVTIAYRYFLVNVMLFMPITIIGYKFIIDFFYNKYPTLKPLFALILICFSIGMIYNGMGNSINTHRDRPLRIGEWLKDNENLFTGNNDKSLLVILDAVDADPCVFAGVNFAIYRDATKGLSDGSQASKYCVGLKKIIENKIPSQYVFLTNKLYSNNTLLEANLIMVSKDKKEDIRMLEALPNVERVKTPYEKYAIFFKIKPRIQSN